MIANTLRKREWYKYELLDKELNELGFDYGFEYTLGRFVYDLVVFDERIIVEFDGPEHSYMNESDKIKEAEKNGYMLFRVKVKPKEVIEPSCVLSILSG